MRFKKATPGEGEERRAELFSYTPTKHGLSNTWSAWCAHEPYWCKAHEHTDKDPGTKVCVHWFTDGALPCPRCMRAARTTIIAYVAVWRAVDLKPCLVICHESASDMLMSLAFGTFCFVGRVAAQDGCFVKAHEHQEKWVSDLPYRQGPCDLAATLLTIWRYPALEAWLRSPRKAGGEGTGEARSPSRLRLASPPAAVDAADASAVREDKPDGALGGSVDDVTRRILSRASKNGKPGGNGHV